jgi:hypothetical protein
MTKNILITNLKEVQGIKIICNKCNSYFMAPIGGKGKPPNMCVMCGKDLNGDYLASVLETIKTLVSYCEREGFEAVIETEEEIKTT